MKHRECLARALCATACLLTSIAGSTLSSDSISAWALQPVTPVHIDTLPLLMLSELRVYGERVFARTGPAEDSSGVVHVIDVWTGKEVWAYTGAYSSYTVSDGLQKAVVFHRFEDEGELSLKVFDWNGRLLFSKESFSNELIPSPNGLYWCTNGSGADDIGSFVILDRQGNEVIRNTKDWTSGWNAAWLSDTVLVATNSKIARLLSIPSGEVLDSITFTDSPLNLPELIPATDRSRLFMTCRLGPAEELRDTLIFLTPDLKESHGILLKGFCKSRGAIGVGRWLGLALQKRPDRFFTLFDVDEGSELWSAIVPNCSSSGMTSIRHVSGTANYICLVSHSMGHTEYATIQDSGTCTYIFRISQMTGALLGQEVRQGVVYLVASPDGKTIRTVTWSLSTNDCLMIAELRIDD